MGLKRRNCVSIWQMCIGGLHGSKGWLGRVQDIVEVQGGRGAGFIVSMRESGEGTRRGGPFLVGNEQIGNGRSHGHGGIRAVDTG